MINFFLERNNKGNEQLDVIKESELEDCDEKGVGDIGKEHQIK